MLHELIVALAGFPGNVIVYDESTTGENDKIAKFVVSPDVGFLSPPQAAVINRVCKLASMYKELCFYVEAQQDAGGILMGHTMGTNKYVVESLLGGALFVGINEILAQYRKRVVDLEKMALEDETFSVWRVMYEMEGVEVQIYAVLGLIKKIMREKLRGGSMVNEIYLGCVSGVGDVHQAMLQLLAHTNRVLFRMLAAWMTHAALNDPYHELFIRERHTTPAPTPNRSTESSDSTPQQQQQQQNTPPQTNDVWHRFELRTSMLPTYVSQRTAQKILFIGKAVRIIQNTTSPNSFSSPSSSSTHQTNQQFSTLETEVERVFAEANRFFLDSTQIEQEDSGTRGVVGSGGVGVFDVVGFDAGIERVRAFVASLLWDVMLCKVEFVQHLKAMRWCFTLGRGAMAKTLVEETRGLMTSPPSRNASEELNACFQIAASRDGLDEDTLQRIRLSLSTDTNNLHQYLPLALHQHPIAHWFNLSLSYEVPWGAKVVLHSEALKKYDDMFRFLFLLTRVKDDLEQCWQPLNSMRRSTPQKPHNTLSTANNNKQQQQQQGTKNASQPSAQFSRALRVVCLLRHRMAFVVDNLIYFFQVDLLDHHTSQLMQTVNTSRDFEEILAAHNNYIQTLHSLTANTHRVLVHSIFNILSLCLDLCGVAKTAIQRRSKRTQNEGEGLESLNERAVGVLSEAFEKQLGLLFVVLSGVSERQASDGLGRLLLRLDFNRYLQRTTSAS